MQRLAKIRGGKCLSSEYGNNKTKLEWQCKEGHRWKAVPSSVMSGSWCGKCSNATRMVGLKLSIEEMQNIAAERGGRCISAEYVDALTKLEWECADGHKWRARPHSIKRGDWCPECGGTKKLTINDMHDLADSRGGKCLSSEYINIRTALEWECSEGHRWSEPPDKIRYRKYWCPKCLIISRGTTPAGNKSSFSRRPQKTIHDMQVLATSRGGACLSRQYKTSRTNLRWRCEEGHVWNATPAAIIAGHWCHKCSGNLKKTIEEMQQLASSRGGKCLSTKYENAMTKLHWECSEGHDWWAAPNNVVHAKSWCPECSGNVKQSVDDMHQLAKTKNGKFLSKTYSRSTDLHLWQCEDGHVFECRPNDVTQGVWCSVCSKLLNERICRAHFESIFGHQFPTRRPRWLLNTRGNCMELDGYCEQLRIAFEYHGVQHFKQIEHFQRDHGAFRSRRDDDARRRELCAQHNVCLIEVPYTIGQDEMHDFIISECKKAGVPDNLISKTQKPDLSKVFSPKSLERYNKLAEKKGGRCLSKVYRGAHVNLKWQCDKGHKFPASPHNVRKGHWCPECAGRKRKTIADARNAAAKKGGFCRSKTMKNANTPLLWECASGHQWTAPYNRIAKGDHWCSECAGLKRKTIEQMRELAQNKNGKCMSDVYVNTNTKLQWECSKGHRWHSKPANIIGGSWCPECYNQRRGKTT